MNRITIGNMVSEPAARLISPRRRLAATEMYRHIKFNGGKVFLDYRVWRALAKLGLGRRDAITAADDLYEHGLIDLRRAGNQWIVEVKK